MPAATALLPPQAAYTNEPIYRLSVEQYHGLIDRGKLTPEDPVELIEGILVFKLPKNEPHIASVRRCRRAIAAALPTGSFFYDTEQPITLSDGEPEPDGMVLVGVLEDYDSEKPQPSDVALLIEVSDTTLDRDRGTKLRSYARAGVTCYWIVNLVDRQIEVYTQPEANHQVPRFGSIEIFKPGDAVPLVLEGQSITAVQVVDLLAPV